MISLHSLYHLRFPDDLRNILIGALLTVILVPAFASFAVSEDNGLAEVRATYDRLHSKLIESQDEKPIDNVQGSIAWGSSYQLDSYVSMYQATGDTVYLDHFLRLADRVLAARADKSGELDFRGRLTFGWLSGGHYTYGKPVVLKDSDGNPSVQIQTIGNSYNDKVSIEIIAGATAASFTVKCIDHRNPDQPKETLLRDLTMETAVREVNPKEGEPRLIQLKRIGDRPPAPIGPFIPETQLMTFHGHHTGRILTPMARFCDLVINNDDLEKYREKAEDYLLEIRISMAEHDQFLVEEDDWGYTIFERGSPFWCDGVPEPHNTMACSGSTYIHLYRATGEPYFLDRATRLARMFKRNHIPQADGTWLFHYWWGPMETGWNEGEGTSDHLGSYAGQSVPEDISHLQLTLMFLVDCYENGIVFEEEDLDRWAKTFNTVLYHEDDEGPYLPFRVDGSQSGNLVAVPTMSSMAFWRLEHVSIRQWSIGADRFWRRTIPKPPPRRSFFPTPRWRKPQELLKVSKFHSRMDQGPPNWGLAHECGFFQTVIMKIPIKKGFLGNQRRITMMMDLSSTCDILCKQCFRTVLIPKSAKVSTDQIGILEREVFPYIDRLALSCTGEPLTLRNFKEGLKAAKRAEVPFIRIQSNGTHLSEEMSEFLIDEGLTHLGISLDGATKETFETVRNGAHWDEVIGNIRTFTRLRRERQSSSPSLCLNFTLMKENAEEAVSFIPFAVGLGADSVSFSHLILESWEMKDWSLLYDAPRMNGLLADLREEAKKYNIPSHIPADVPETILPFDGRLIEDVPSHSGPCSAAEEDWMFMLPNGDIFACGNLQDQGPLGNVFQKPLKEIWLGTRNQNFRRNALNGCVEGCDHCKIFASSADPSHEMSYLARRLTSRAAAEMDFESVHRRREPSSSAQTAPAHS